MKVMLIEDDFTMVSLLSMLLEMEGFSVVKMPEPDSGKIIATIQHEKPSVILMDVNLSQLNGLELLRQIREIQELSDMHVLMSSGLDFSQECMDAGADGFIMKPYMPDDLIGKIHQVVNHTR